MVLVVRVAVRAVQDGLLAAGTAAAKAGPVAATAVAVATVVTVALAAGAGAPGVGTAEATEPVGWEAVLGVETGAALGLAAVGRLVELAEARVELVAMGALVGCASTEWAPCSPCH